MLCLVTQSCLTLCNPMDCSPQAPLSMEFQAVVLEWIAISFSRGSSQSTVTYCIAQGMQYSVITYEKTLKKNRYMYN